MTIAMNADRFWDRLDQMARIGATADGGVATATRLTLQLDARGNIPSLLRVAANIRHPDADGNARMEAAFRAVAAEVTARRRVSIDIRRVGGYPRVPSALMLIPGHGGVSHRPSGSISREGCIAGLATMGPAVIEAAGGLA